MAYLLVVETKLPPAHRVDALVEAAGGDPSLHTGWLRTRVAEETDHPSNLAAAALDEALAATGIPASKLDLVIYSGVSRDYPPSWSVAHAVMRRVGVGRDALGLDLNVGCLGAVAAMQTARGWMTAGHVRYAAVIGAERWSYTIDRSDPGKKTLWHHSDGAAAAILSREPGVGNSSSAELRAFHFTNRADLNDVVRVRYGGTRYPSPPAGVAPYTRERNWEQPTSELRAIYRENYRRVYDGLVAQTEPPDAVACNQVSPNFVASLSELFELDPSKIIATGHENGHVGTADVLLGLQVAMQEHKARFFGIGSSPYACGGVACILAPH